MVECQYKFRSVLYYIGHRLTAHPVVLSYHSFTMVIHKLTAISFITSIKAVRIAITLPTSWDALSIRTLKLVGSAIWLWTTIDEINHLITYFVNRKPHWCMNYLRRLEYTHTQKSAWWLFGREFSDALNPLCLCLPRCYRHHQTHFCVDATHNSRLNDKENSLGSLQYPT